MTKSFGFSFGSSAAGRAGKGLALALALAGLGIQGCSSEDPSPIAAPAQEAVPQEDANGVDILPGGASQGAAAAAEIDAPGALAKAAPSCVILTQRVDGLRRYAYAKNNCGNTQRFRLIWSFAFDGPCVTVAPGATHGESRGRQSMVTEVRGC